MALQEYQKQLHQFAQAAGPGGPELRIQATVDDLVNRSLSGRKPFDGEGRKGFRDAVIWEEILDAVRREGIGEMILISGNSNDFGKDSALHPGLQEELEALGVAGKAIHLVESVGAFTKLHVRPHP